MMVEDNRRDAGHVPWLYHNQNEDNAANSARGATGVALPHSEVVKSACGSQSHACLLRANRD
jgi:hypothetical protein